MNSSSRNRSYVDGGGIAEKHDTKQVSELTYFAGQRYCLCRTKSDAGRSLFNVTRVSRGFMISVKWETVPLLYQHATVARHTNTGRISAVELLTKGTRTDTVALI